MTRAAVRVPREVVVQAEEYLTALSWLLRNVPLPHGTLDEWAASTTPVMEALRYGSEQGQHMVADNLDETLLQLRNMVVLADLDDGEEDLG